MDRAIESIQRKSENIKKLVITLTPLFLLLTGGGLEALGIIDVMGAEEDNWDDDYYEVRGCTAPDAENYDPDATHDDGSCWWDDNNGGGGGPPHQKIVIGDGMIPPIPMMKNPIPCMCLRVFQAHNVHMRCTEISAWA